jgi:hypothetical protein
MRDLVYFDFVTIFNFSFINYSVRCLSLDGTISTIIHIHMQNPVASIRNHFQTALPHLRGPSTANKKEGGRSETNNGKAIGQIGG